jgi:hypothetical protein
LKERIPLTELDKTAFQKVIDRYELGIVVDTDSSSSSDTETDFDTDHSAEEESEAEIF